MTSTRQLLALLCGAAECVLATVAAGAWLGAAVAVRVRGWVEGAS